MIKYNFNNINTNLFFFFVRTIKKYAIWGENNHLRKMFMLKVNYTRSTKLTLKVRSWNCLQWKKSYFFKRRETTVQILLSIKGSRLLLLMWALRIDVGSPSSDFAPLVCRPLFIQTTSLLIPLGQNEWDLARILFTWSSIKVVHMVKIHCISGSQDLNSQNRQILTRRYVVCSITL